MTQQGVETDRQICNCKTNCKTRISVIHSEDQKRITFRKWFSMPRFWQPKTSFKVFYWHCPICDTYVQSGLQKFSNEKRFSTQYEQTSLVENGRIKEKVITD